MVTSELLNSEEMIDIIEYRITTKDDLDLVMKTRMEMLLALGDLPSDYVFEEEFLRRNKEYYENEDQTTVLAFDGEAIGCATICYQKIIPGFKNPTGKRGHIMTVYTKNEYRRQGIASQMLKILIEEAKKREVMQITLDASNLGRLVYQKLGFVDSPTYMIMQLYKLGEN